MSEFIKVAQKSEISEGQGKVVEASGKTIALFNVSGEFFAIDNTCKHRGGPLGEGMLDGTTVTCPLHSWQYNVTTGECETNPAVSQERYETKVEGEDILAAL